MQATDSCRRRPKTAHWSKEEIESALILHKMIRSKDERLAHLNVCFGNSRTLSAFKTCVDRNRSPQEHLKYENILRDRGTALSSLAGLLGRTLILEGESIWYREELIALATLSSGVINPDALRKVRKRLVDEYGIPRHDSDIQSQILRMQSPDFRSHSIWIRYHQGGRSQLQPAAGPFTEGTLKPINNDDSAHRGSFSSEDFDWSTEDSAWIDTLASEDEKVA
ncbi:MAG: hypothetical protein L6R39_003500 [Caloplaca ligustica]|nr:MAG: hypothetical protein L6R39_003500 [Caloplaca ligustica]